MRWRFLMSTTAAFLLGACSGGGGATTGGTTCPLKAVTCWNGAIAEAQACVPTTVGTIGSDNQTCTFDDGTIAKFDVAVTFPIVGFTFNPSVTITKSGAECARAVMNGASPNYTLTTESGSYTAIASVSGESLTCGNGTSLTTKWSDCEIDAGVFDSTGEVGLDWGSYANQVSVGFQAYFPFDAGFSSLAPWFSCQKP
jgi:hypothetical protein